MKRRDLLKEGAAWASVGITVTVLPPAAGMTATVTLSNNATYVFAEAGGSGSSAQTLGAYTDPRNAFVQNRVRVTRSDFPYFRVEFARMADGTWASVEFWFGQAVTDTSAPYNIGAGYSVTVTGDFAGSATTPYHWWGSRWRISGNKANGLRVGRNDWTYPMSTYAQLITDKLIPQIDPSLASAPTLMTPAAPYTAMGSSSYALIWDSGSDYFRPDQRLFTSWNAELLASMSPTASSSLITSQPTFIASVLALGEAAASIPFCFFDAAHGCMYEAVVNNAGGTPVWDLPAPNPHAQMGVIMSGAPGTYTINSQPGNGSDPSLTDSVSGGLWWLPFNVTVPAGGSITVVIGGNSGREPQPKGTPVYQGTSYDPSQPAGLTFTWADPTTYLPSTTWGLDAAYDPETGYVAYILWRDPWYLFSVQANAAFDSHVPWSMAIVEQGAWDYRNCACALAATPVGVPSWLLPPSTLLVMLQAIQTVSIASAVNGTAEWSTVFHVMDAGSGPPTNRDNPVCDTGQVGWNGGWNDPWANALWAQSVCFGLINRPTDTNGQTLATYLLAGIDSRFNNTSGWPQTLNTVVHQQMHQGDGTGPYYTSVASAWTGQAHYLLTPHNVASTDPNCYQHALPSSLTITDYHDFSLFDFSALSLAAQAGITTFNGSRDFLRASAVAFGAFELVHGWKQV